MNEIQEILEIDGALYFNAVVINRNHFGFSEALIVKDIDSRGVVQNKIPGGMMNKCDLDFDCWLKEIERLLKEKVESQRFSDEEIKEILLIEKDLIRRQDPKAGIHRMAEYGAIREAIEEINIWPKKLEPLHFWRKEKIPLNAKSKPVNYNFFFVQEYAVPQGWAQGFISSDKDVKGKLWVSPEELLSKDWNNPQIISLIGTHRGALEELPRKFSHIVSEQVSVWE